jgi:hypothetical protein
VLSDYVVGYGRGCGGRRRLGRDSRRYRVSDLNAVAAKAANLGAAAKLACAFKPVTELGYVALVGFVAGGGLGLCGLGLGGLPQVNDVCGCRAVV